MLLERLPYTAMVRETYGVMVNIIYPVVVISYAATDVFLICVSA